MGKLLTKIERKRLQFENSINVIVNERSFVYESQFLRLYAQLVDLRTYSQTILYNSEFRDSSNLDPEIRSMISFMNRVSKFRDSPRSRIHYPKVSTILQKLHLESVLPPLI